MSETETLEVNKEQTTAPAQEDLKKEPTQGTDDQPVYTAKQFHDAMKGARKHGEERIMKQFEGVDVEAYKSLMAQEDARKLEESKKKGEFEKILKEQAEKSNAKISALTDELHKIKVEGALLDAASKHKAINPGQVVKLVRDQVKMSETGKVEIIDPMSGNTRYNDAGEPLEVETAVTEWLKANPHFVQSGPSGSGAQSNQNPEGVKQVDLEKLDLTKAEDRAIYKKLRPQIFGQEK